MLIVEQYSSLFSLYLYGLLVLPAVVLCLLGRKSKWMSCVISTAMIVLLLGPLSLQMWEFAVFLAGEGILLLFFRVFRRRSSSELVYYLVFALSMLPLLFVKAAGKTAYGSVIGFVGVSYVSFKVWELLILIHDGKTERMSVMNMALFLLFGPPFSSGPICRFEAFTAESEKVLPREEYLEDYLVPGIKKLILGVFYKFSFAFLLSEYVLSRYENVSVKGAIAYLYAYTLFLFFDFAGYSLMAVGTGYLLGIKMPDNFNKPFLARNIKEFWERWHISLSTWFNELLFSRFVLNNVRNGLFRSPKTAARWAYLVTMLTMGLWHGFYWHYILYGLYHGVLLILTDIWLKSKVYRKVKKLRGYAWGSRFVCFHLIALGMLLFSGFLLPN